MTEALQVAIATGGLAVLSTYLTVRAGNQRVMAELEKHNAIQDEKIENLTREVRKHNNFAEKIPVLEEKISQLEKTNN